MDPTDDLRRLQISQNPIRVIPTSLESSQGEDHDHDSSDSGDLYYQPRILKEPTSDNREHSSPSVSVLVDNTLNADPITSGQLLREDALNAPSVPRKASTIRWIKGRLLGSKKHGNVFLAMIPTTGEMIAVKQFKLRKNAGDHDNQCMKAVNAFESATLKELDHPNIVQYLGMERTPEILNIFMEYVSGGSIGDCLRKQGKFGVCVVKSFTGQITAGLEYLHSKDILHRGLRADNILVDPNGICKISNFDISERILSTTLYWMAPEVVCSPDGFSRYSAKADIWSLGCVWHEMHTGEQPWKGQDMFYVLDRIFHEKQSPPLPEGAELPPDAIDFRDACFVVEPQTRPNASDLRLQPYLTLPPEWKFVGLTD